MHDQAIKLEETGSDNGLGEAVMRLSSMKVSLVVAVIGRVGLDEFVEVVSRAMEEPAAGELLFGKTQYHPSRLANVKTLKSLGGGRASHRDVADFILSAGVLPGPLVALFECLKNDQEIRSMLDGVSKASATLTEAILTSCQPHLGSKARREAYSRGRSRGVDAEALAEDLVSEGALHAFEKLRDRIYVMPGVSPHHAASQTCSYFIKTAAGRMVDAAWDLSMEISLPRSVIRTWGGRFPVEGAAGEGEGGDATRQGAAKPWRGILKARLSLASTTEQDDKNGLWNWDPPAADPFEASNADFEIWRENLLHVAALTIATMNKIDSVNVLMKYLNALTPLFESVCYLDSSSIKNRRDLAILSGVSESRMSQVLSEMSSKARRTLDRWRKLYPEDAVVKVAGLALERTIDSKAKFSFIPAAIIRKLRRLADLMKDDHETAFLKLIGSPGTSSHGEDDIEEIGGYSWATENWKKPGKKVIDIIKGKSTPSTNKENDMSAEETTDFINGSRTQSINEENDLRTGENHDVIYDSQTQSINKENGMNINTKGGPSSTAASSRGPSSQSPFAGYCDNMTKKEIATLLLDGVSKARSAGATNQSQLTTLCLQSIVASVDLGILGTFLEAALGSAGTTETKAVNGPAGNGERILSEPKRTGEKEEKTTPKSEPSNINNYVTLEQDNERGIKIIKSVLAANPGIATRAAEVFSRGEHANKKWTKKEALLCLLTAKPETESAVRNNGHAGEACYNWMRREKNRKEIWKLYERALHLGRQPVKA